jgi:hypothetical protein
VRRELLINTNEIITIQVKYKNVEKTFSGNVEEVWFSMNRFFGKFISSFEIANKLVLSIDLQQLAEECVGLVAFSEEGYNLLVPRSKTTDNETLILVLLANYLGFKLGRTNSDRVPKDELQMRLGKSAKITSTRLGELVKNGVVARTDDDKYRITTFGLTQIQKDVLPRIKPRVRA